AVRAHGVRARRRPRRVEQALLRDQDEWALGVPALPTRALGVDDLRGRRAEVDGSCASDLRRAPGDRVVERVVDLEHAGAVTPPVQTAAVARWKGVARQS